MGRIDLDNLPPGARNEAERQLDVLRRGAVEIYTEAELLAKLAASVHEGRPLRVKLGMDPTAPDIHVGHTVVMGKMRQFQDLGHKAVLIIGDYTARIGDPSGEDHTRPVLTEDEIRKNAKTYFDQAGKVLDTGPERLQIRCNSEWLEKLSFADVLKLAARMTVARMMERDTFEIRYKAGDPIGIHEFLYPLVQGHDSVAIEADVELGGTDQTFNCLAGRDLMRDAGLEPQVVLTTPLLVGLDGTEKMSKSKGNTVGVTEPPKEMFGKLMSLPDRLMQNYFTLLTYTPLPEVQELLQTSHPRDAKERLAKTIVARYYDAETAANEAAEFRKVFSEHQKPSDIRETYLPPNALYVDARSGRYGLASAMTASGLTSSNSEAMRKIEEGAVWLDDKQITDPKATIDPKAATGSTLRLGRKKWATLYFKDESDQR